MADSKKTLPVEKEDITIFGPSNENATIRATTWEDRFRDYISPLIRGGLVNIGRVGGAVAGATTGNPFIAAGTSLLGGTGADLAYQEAQRLSPKVFGAPPESIPEGIKQAGLNTIMDAGATGLINKITTPLSKLAIKDRLKYEFLNRFFPPDPRNPAIQEAIGVDPTFQPTVAQATQNKLAKVVTDIFVPEREMLPKYAGQTQALSQEAENLATKVGYGRATEPYTLSKVGTSKAKAQFRSAEQVEDALYENAEKNLIPQNKLNAYRVIQSEPVKMFDPQGKPITVQGKSRLEPITIEGPVFPKKTNEFANRVIEDIDGFLNDPTNELGRDVNVVSSLNEIRNRLATFRNVAVDIQGRPVISYKSAKNTKMILTDLFEKAPEGIKKRFSETIYALRNSLGEDIKDSSNSWDAKSRNALLQAYHQTKQNVARFESKIGKKIVNRFNDPDIIQENVLQEALGSKQTALQYVASTRSRSEIGSQFLKNILDSAYDANGNFTAETAIKKLTEQEDIAKTVLSSDQRNTLKNLLRKMQVVPQGEGNIGKVAVAIRRTGAALGLTSGLVAGGLTGNLSTGVYTYGTIIAGFPLARKIVKNLMLNPQNARLVTHLTKLPPESTEAQRIIKNLLKGPLKGVQFELQYQNGEQLGSFEAREDGRLHPIQ